MNQIPLPGRSSFQCITNTQTGPLKDSLCISTGESCAYRTTVRFRLIQALLGFGFWIRIPREKSMFVSGVWSDPAWSKDGARLAISNRQIYITRLDHSELRQLTFEGSNCCPAWSPDGQWIAYNSNVNDSVRTWVMHPDGTEKRAISPPGIPTITASWLPDNRILHARADGIFVMGLDGTGGVRLTTGTEDCCPVASPDGRRIAFQRRINNELPQVWLIDIDGASARQMTTHGGTNPSWSPDGTRIVYTRENWRSNDPGNGVLWTVDVGTGAEDQLAHKWPEQCLARTGGSE
jgi:TolB protein